MFFLLYFYQINELTMLNETLVRERNFYFTKLREIEVMCQQESTTDQEKELKEQITNILYECEDGFTAPAAEEEEGYEGNLAAEGEY